MTRGGPDQLLMILIGCRRFQPVFINSIDLNIPPMWLIIVYNYRVKQTIRVAMEHDLCKMLHLYDSQYFFGYSYYSFETFGMVEKYLPYYTSVL